MTGRRGWMGFAALALAAGLVGCPGAPPPAVVPAAPPAPARVELRWEGNADLDLELWSETGAYLTDAVDWGPRAETNDPAGGMEQFEFRAYAAAEDLRGGTGRDFSATDCVVAVERWRGDDRPCTATISLTGRDGRREEFRRVFTPGTRPVWAVARYRAADGAFTAPD